MKELIKKILKEQQDNDWDWLIDVEHKPIDYEFLSTKVHEYFYGEGKGEEIEGYGDEYETFELSPKQIEERKYFVMEFMDREFSDINYEDGKFYMNVGDWSLSDLFKDTTSDYGYIGRGLAKVILSDDDYWEPYYDTYSDWKDEVWDIVNPDNYNTILDGIIKKYTGEELDYENLIINENFKSLIQEEPSLLGDLINDEDLFNGIKAELGSIFHNSYNGLVHSQYHNACTNAITDLIGPYDWKAEETTYRDGNESKKVMKHSLRFDVTNIIFDVLRSYFMDYCLTKWECQMEYSSFFNNLTLLLNEEIWEKPLYPRGDEYPDHRELEKEFNERVSDELTWCLK